MILLCLLRYKYYEHSLLYSEVFTTTLSCDMNFETFPYDYHECIINFKNWYGSEWRVQLQSPKIYMLDKNGKEIGGSKFNYTKSGRLNYNFNLESLPNSVYLENGLNWSLAQVKLNFERTEKSQAEIFSGYHTTTGLFAFLSLFSFFINIDAVPGTLFSYFLNCLPKHRIFLYSFREDHSFLSLEIGTNSNSCHNISIFYIIN